MWVAWGGSSLAVAGLGLAPDIWVVGIAEFVVFALLMYGNVLWNPLMQELVPAEMIGRASSVDYLVSLGLSPLGILLAGVAAAAIGTRETIVLGGVLGAFTAGVLFIPGVRDPEKN